jgi:hypothetical protein
MCSNFYIILINLFEGTISIFYLIFLLILSHTRAYTHERESNDHKKSMDTIIIPCSSKTHPTHTTTLCVTIDLLTPYPIQETWVVEWVMAPKPIEMLKP